MVSAKLVKIIMQLVGKRNMRTDEIAHVLGIEKVLPARHETNCDITLEGGDVFERVNIVKLEGSDFAASVMLEIAPKHLVSVQEVIDISRNVEADRAGEAGGDYVEFTYNMNGIDVVFSTYAASEQLKYIKIVFHETTQ